MIRPKLIFPPWTWFLIAFMSLSAAQFYASYQMSLERNRYRNEINDTQIRKSTIDRLSVLYWDGSNLLKDILDEQQPLPTKEVKAKAKAWEKNIEIYLRKHFDEFYVTRFYAITGKKIVVPARFSSLKHRNLYATVQARMENLFEILLDMPPRKPVFDKEDSPTQ